MDAVKRSRPLESNERVFSHDQCSNVVLPNGVYVGTVVTNEQSWTLGDNGMDRSFAALRIVEAPNDASEHIGRTVVVW